MAENYIPMNVDQTDRASPITENLMNTIRENLDFLNANIGGGGSDGDGSGATAIAVELQGGLSDIENGIPVDFPNYLSEGTLSSAKILFQDLRNVRKPFTAKCQLLRRRNLVINAESVEPLATVAAPSLAVEVNEVTMASAPAADPIDYTGLERWGDRVQDAEWYSRIGSSVLIKLSGSVNRNVWAEGVYLRLLQGEDGDLIADGNITAYDPTDNIVFFESETAAPAASGSPSDLRVNLDRVYSVELDSSAGSDYVLGETAQITNKQGKFASVRILEKNLDGTTLVFEDLRLFGVGSVTDFIEDTAGRILCGRVNVTNNENITAPLSWDMFFVADAQATLKRADNNDPVTIDGSVVSYSGNVAKIKNVHRGATTSSMKVSLERKAWRMTSNANFNAGDEILVNNEDDGSHDSPNADERRSLVVRQKVGTDTLILEERAADFPGITDITLGSGNESSRLKINLTESAAASVKIGDFVSLTDFNGNAREFYPVVGVDVQNDINIVIQTGTEGIGKARGVTGSSRVAVGVNAVYRALSAEEIFSDDSINYLNGSIERDFSNQILSGLDFVNTPDYTFSIVFGSLVDGLKGISVEVR